MLKFLKELWFKLRNRKQISKINSILRSCDDILEKKGYHDKDEHFFYRNDKLYINIRRYEGHTLPSLGSRFKNYMFFPVNGLSSFMDTSLDIFCWCYLLPALYESRYQQYQKEVQV